MTIAQPPPPVFKPLLISHQVSLTTASSFLNLSGPRRQPALDAARKRGIMRVWPESQANDFSFPARRRKRDHTHPG
ncbi:MAG: hypothetical protein KIS63_19150, partial [Caldilineales bacterium]|nr:hypothetical protein [Caldilineales bacterium]